MGRQLLRQHLGWAPGMGDTRQSVTAWLAPRATGVSGGWWGRTAAPAEDGAPLLSPLPSCSPCWLGTQAFGRERTPLLSVFVRRACFLLCPQILGGSGPGPGQN